MATNNNEVLVAQNHSFLLDGIDLKDLQSRLKRCSKQAVDLLVKTLEDDKIDLKTRLDCAKVLLNFQVTVAKEISADQMGRLIAEIKVVQNGNAGTIGTDEKPKPPRLDFDTVQTV